MDANHCFKSDFTTRKSMKAFSTTVSFLQLIAAHDFTIFLFDTPFYAPCAESSYEEHCCL